MGFLDSSYIPTSVEAAGRVRSLGHGVEYRIMTNKCRSIMAKSILNVNLESSPPSTRDANWTLYFSKAIAKVSTDVVNRMILLL